MRFVIDGEAPTRGECTASLNWAHEIRMAAEANRKADMPYDHTLVRVDYYTKKPHGLADYEFWPYLNALFLAGVLKTYNFDGVAVTIHGHSGDAKPRTEFFALEVPE